MGYTQPTAISMANGDKNLPEVWPLPGSSARPVGIGHSSSSHQPPKGCVSFVLKIGTESVWLSNTAWLRTVELSETSSWL